MEAESPVEESSTCFLDTSLEMETSAERPCVNYPLARIARIVKAVPGIHKTSKPSLEAIRKAAEDFTRTLAVSVAQFSARLTPFGDVLAKNRAGVPCLNLVNTITTHDMFNFLDDPSILKFISSSYQGRVENCSISNMHADIPFVPNQETESQNQNVDEPIVQPLMKKHGKRPILKMSQRPYQTLYHFFS